MNPGGSDGVVSVRRGMLMQAICDRFGFWIWDGLPIVLGRGFDGPQGTALQKFLPGSGRL